MQTPKSSDQWKGFDKVVTPAHALLEEEYKIGKYTHEVKAKHSLGSSKVVGSWVPKKDKPFSDGDSGLAFETTQTMCGSPLKVKFDNSGLNVHRDCGNVKIGSSGAHFNPWWGWTNKRNHGFTWWDQNWKCGYVFQWGRFQTANEFVFAANDAKNGPGDLTHNSQWKFVHGNNEWSGVNQTWMRPGSPGWKSAYLSYARHEADWTSFLRVKKAFSKPNDEAPEESLEVGGRYAGKHEDMTWQAGALAWGQLRQKGAMRVQMGFLLNMCKEWSLYKKVAYEQGAADKEGKNTADTSFSAVLRHTRNDVAGLNQEYSLGLQTSWSDLKNVKWGFKSAHNL